MRAVSARTAGRGVEHHKDDQQKRECWTAGSCASVPILPSALATAATAQRRRGLLRKIVLILLALSTTVGAQFTPAAVTIGSQTITFDAIPNQIFGISPFPIIAQASSGLPVGLASTTPAVCKLAVDLVTLLSAGTCSITASQGGNTNYSAATSVTRSFTVKLANPSGMLMAAAGSPFMVGTSPTSVAVGDFNGDGKLDLAAANSDDNSVTVLLGNGSGGFTAAPGSPFAVGDILFSLGDILFPWGDFLFPWWRVTSTGMAFRTLP